MNMDFDAPPRSSQTKLMNKMLSRESSDEETIEEQHPMALMIKANADDNPTF